MIRNKNIDTACVLDGISYDRCMVLLPYSQITLIVNAQASNSLGVKTIADNYNTVPSSLQFLLSTSGSCTIKITGFGPKGGRGAPLPIEETISIDAGTSIQTVNIFSYVTQVEVTAVAASGTFSLGPHTNNAGQRCKVPFPGRLRSTSDIVRVQDTLNVESWAAPTQSVAGNYWDMPQSSRTRGAPGIIVLKRGQEGTY